ncbi:Hypothetical protein NTJ_03381 [Nesidiocoris tenuis]|uniref:Uncharacterized protein n=1 Tax=Nesidiocoris tenuis TaxID=355587 RepID=A0ABN7AH18_9HEMI|nr:Hypothetical protein NTJ_03381 [Nesidiocoris tenuis]
MKPSRLEKIVPNCRRLEGEPQAERKFFFHGDFRCRLSGADVSKRIPSPPARPPGPTVLAALMTFECASKQDGIPSRSWKDDSGLIMQNAIPTRLLSRVDRALSVSPAAS